MKKLFLTSIAVILAASFCFGALATNVSAEKPVCFEECYDNVLYKCCHRLVGKNDLHAYKCTPIGECE